MKICIKCNVEKDDSGFWSQNINGRLYLKSWCKSCSKEYLRNWSKGKTQERRKAKVAPLPDKKECTRCKIEKDRSDFRIRTDKRAIPHWQYLNPTCKKCDASEQRERVRKQRGTPDGRERHNRWAREFHKRHRGKCLSAMKKRRESNHGKKYRKEYDAAHKERIAELGRERNRRYCQDLILNIKPTYIVRMFSHPRVGIPAAVTRKNPELIEACQTLIAIKRFLKTKNNKEWKISYNSERLC